MNELAALRQALAAEQAIVYGYGVVGAHLSGSAETYAGDRLAAHMTRRDQLAALIIAAGATPAVARAAYRLPFPVAGPRAARQLGGHLEQGANDAYWDLTAAAAARSRLRVLAVGWLSDSAVAAAHWGASQALPGQPS